MIPIYICDDNEKEKRFLSKIVGDIILIEDLDMRVVLAAGTPEEIIAHRRTHTDLSVYILDVDLKHETHNGFTLAKQLRELDARGFIIFVTIHEEMLYEIFRYRVEAMDYMIKEEPQKLMERIRESLTEISKLAASDKYDHRNYFTVKTEGSIFHIPKEDILYFKTSGEIHPVTLHSKDRVLEFRGDINALEKEIGTGFLKIHRSCLVRAEKIRQIDYRRSAVIIEDGSECQFSKNGKRVLKDFFGK